MSMNDRGQDFEARYAHEQERAFWIEVRRNKLLGLWAAEKLGLGGEEADAYAASIVQIELGAGGSEDVFRRIRTNFDAAGIAQSDHQIRRHMEELRAEAENQIATS